MRLRHEHSQGENQLFISMYRLLVNFTLLVRLTPSETGPTTHFGHSRDLPGSAQRTSPRAQDLRLRKAWPDLRLAY